MQQKRVEMARREISAEADRLDSRTADVQPGYEWGNSCHARRWALRSPAAAIILVICHISFKTAELFPNAWDQSIKQIWQREQFT